MNNDNIVNFAAVKGGKQEEQVPQHNYKVVLFDGGEIEAHGFLIFTPQHVAVMRSTEEGALPILVVSLDNVKYTTIVEVEPGLPF